MDPASARGMVVYLETIYVVLLELDCQISLSNEAAAFQEWKYNGPVFLAVRWGKDPCPLVPV